MAFIIIFLLFFLFPCKSYSIDNLIIQGYKAYADKDTINAEKDFLQFLKNNKNINEDSFRAKLGLAYIYLLDSDKKNISEGRKLLKDIIDNCKNESLRGKSILTLGRTYQLERNDEKQVDIFKQAINLYEQYLGEYPQGELKSRVLIYLSQIYFRNKDEKEIERGIDILEKFLNSLVEKEDKYTADIAYTLGEAYHILKKDFVNSAKYLSIAVDKGIEDRNIYCDTMYKVATIYDKYLKQPNKALKYYKLLVKQFPIDRRINLVSNRIKEIE